MTRGALIAAVVFASVSNAGAQDALAREAPPPPAARVPPPGEGVICALAIYTLVNEVGGQCFPGGNPEFQAEVGRSVSKLDAFVLRNSDMTRAALAKFKADQGQVGAPKERLCKGDAITLYRALESGGAQRLRSSVDDAVARPGKPTWGTCF
jgi:hypothetical protein